MNIHKQRKKQLEGQELSGQDGSGDGTDLFKKTF